MGALNPHITPEVIVWTIAALVGCVVSYLSLREINRNEAAIFVATPGAAAAALLRVVRKDRRNELLRGLAQVFALVAGLLSLFFTTPQPAPPPSVAGFLILALLIGLELVLVYNSLQDYLSNRASVKESEVGLAAASHM